MKERNEGEVEQEEERGVKDKNRAKQNRRKCKPFTYIPLPIIL